MFKSIASALARIFTAIGGIAKEVAVGFRWVMKDGKWVAEKILKPVAAAAQHVYEDVAPIAASVGGKVLRGAATVAAIPFSIFAGAPSAASTQSVDTSADRLAAEARANFEKSEREVAQHDLPQTAAECARQQAQAVLYPPVCPPSTGHLEPHERVWIYSIDTKAKARAVMSSLPEDIEWHLSGDVTSLRLHRVPTRAQISAIRHEVEEDWAMHEAALEAMQAAPRAVGPR